MDIREWRPGRRTGIARFLEEFLRAATAAGPQDRFVLVGDAACEVRVDAENVDVIRIPERWTPWWDQVLLPRQLARDRVTVFLSPYYKAPLRAPCPVVVTIHDLFFIGYLDRSRPLFDTALTALARLYARRAAAIIADSEHSKREIVRRLGVDPAKVTVIPVGLGPEFAPAPLADAVRRRYGVGAPYVLYVGNFKPHKNLPALLRAYARLPESLRATHELVLAGGDPERRPALEALAGALGLADRVRFPGRIDDRDLPQLYAGCALFVLPSLEEGFGLPALEAMACGAPVVASNRASVPEVVGDAAILVDPEDEAALARAMTEVLSAPDVRERLVRQGLARAREFSPERTSARVLAVLREASARR